MAVDEDDHIGDRAGVVFAPPLLQPHGRGEPQHHGDMGIVDPGFAPPLLQPHGHGDPQQSGDMAVFNHGVAAATSAPRTLGELQGVLVVGHHGAASSPSAPPPLVVELDADVNVSTGSGTGSDAAKTTRITRPPPLMLPPPSSLADLELSATSAAGVSPTRASRLPPLPPSSPAPAIASPASVSSTGGTPRQRTSPHSSTILSDSCSGARGHHSPRTMMEIRVEGGAGGDSTAPAARLLAREASLVPGKARGKSRYGFRLFPSRRRGLNSNRSPLDVWTRESFIYTAVLMLFSGVAAYLGTILQGWLPIARIVFVLLFGASAGLAFTGAMALVSRKPLLYVTQYSEVVSRLTFILGCCAFEAGVYYLIGITGFLAWLLTATATVYGMGYFWKEDDPEGVELLVSAGRYVRGIVCQGFLLAKARLVQRQ